LFLLSGGLLAVLFLVRQIVALPELVELFRRVVSLAFIVATVWLLGLLMASRRRLLWRVRVKLILSYVFLGFVPVVLVVTFALAGGSVLYNNVAAYLFHEGVRDIMDDVRQAAEAAAAQISSEPGDAAATLGRTYSGLIARYSEMSLAVVRTAPDATSANAPERPVTTAGAWRHGPAPATVPAWAAERPFVGMLAYSSPGPDGPEAHLLFRATYGTVDGRTVVVADLPLDTEIMARLDDRTGTRIRTFRCDRTDRVGEASAPLAAAVTRADDSGGFMLFSRTVAFMDCTPEWETGTTGRATFSLEAPLGRLYDRLISVQPNALIEALGFGFLAVLAVLGGLLLVVQGAALVMGALLARSITYAVHELFVGTERIQQGDFAYRIRIESEDQLGDLAGSFNRMSSSIEHLLHVQREKQRLDEELRIAREIQKSLLPDEPPRIEGLQIADLCEPAREVGGDYYDFFVLGPRRLGVLIADVSGKGTSAALYMAELKGLMLALSHDEPSPRQLLIEVNDRLAGQLDSRSFITMTYAVLDLDACTLTHARAGHTPLVLVSGGRSEVILPNGMVIGLRLPGAEQRFADMLEEDCRPIGPGDVIVLYTDGVTEAMDVAGELFGEEGLERVLSSHHGLDPAGIRERVVREVKAFVREAEPHDDMTMVILKMQGDPSHAREP
jgi:sigma-B regulation protein RsbU (phosphoserine phosphatase)